jgi:hypothetical protein
MRHLSLLLTCVVGAILAGCSGVPSATLGASGASYTPTCYGTSKPATSSTSCGKNGVFSGFSLDPTSLTLCTAGAGCALSTALINAFVDYGTLVGTVGGSNVTISLGATAQDDANFVVRAIATGPSNIYFNDSAFGPQQIATVAVVAATQNDGRLGIARGYSPEPCNTEPFTIVFKKPAAGLAATIAAPSYATIAVMPAESSITVTPLEGPDVSTYLTVTSGSDSLVVPLNLQVCAVPG